MLRFYFDTAGPGGDCPDDEGNLCADLGAVRCLARRSLCEIVGERCSDADERITYTVRVRDGVGVQVYAATITLSDGPAETPALVLFAEAR